MANNEIFEIKLGFFEGPFDLLLFFVERDELDIYDIPISKITSDFLEYLGYLEKLNVEVASEFILVASTLMRIKVKMLLPRSVIDEEGNEIDPREELVKHLLEYKKYKSVIAMLSKMEVDRLDREKRGNLKKEIKQLSDAINVEVEMQDLDLYKMMKVFQKIIKSYEIDLNKPVHKIVQYPYTIEEQKAKLMKCLVHGKKLSFVEMIDESPGKILIIFNFLSILELLQLRQITISLGEGYNTFWIERRNEPTLIKAQDIPDSTPKSSSKNQISDIADR